MLKLFAVSAFALALAGCTSLSPMSKPEPAFHGPVPIATATPADEALVCLSKSSEVRHSGIVMAVHTVTDQTQKFTSEEGGFVPRDAAAMLVTALQKAGIAQVNRSNTVVTEWEIARAREQILGDGGQSTVGNQTVDFRPVTKGSIRGSDYVIDGAITQLDFNTFSGGGEATVGGIGGGARVFALTAAADIRVTNTQSTRIVRAGSYAKQAVGTEVYASVFRFFSNEMFDIKIGEKSQEGLHAGVRWLMAEAAYDIVSSLVHHNGSCDKYLPTATQELRAEQGAALAAITPN
ncbi:Curli biogenesis system outer membrane secretion channel CsgG [Devosia lucknowensis]|uniref:Curli biogenesis system outer membrane secretion channel CsgG n=1 Tax=Devosia lucknowensis TaxID=1096929 RepID=A0A1Y6F9Y2_9HYPH|nr:CsgG/HfaB family protein [Devosia lucknowensis]SMQ71724.1 Curli biogenesis system outer membrane secretion channel CsgG [Devosia lucknowensis]